MHTTRSEDMLIILALAELAYSYRGTEIEEEALCLAVEFASEHGLNPAEAIQFLK